MRRLPIVALVEVVVACMLFTVGLLLPGAPSAAATSNAARMPAFVQSSQLSATHSTFSLVTQLAFNSQGGGNLTLGNGPVQAHPTVYLIFWGAEWGTATTPSTSAQLVETYFQDAGPSSFSNVLTQYSGISNAVSLGGVYVDAHAPPTDSSCGGATVQDGDIQTEVGASITAAGWPKDGTDALYLVFTPSSLSVNNGAGACSQRLFCAYHKWSPSVSVAYAAIPYPSSASCQVTSSPNNNTIGDSLVNLASTVHFGAITDPQPGSGWVDGTGLEMGQKCAWIFPGVATSINNGGTFALQAEYSNAGSMCTNDYAAHIAPAPNPFYVASGAAGAGPPSQTLTIRNTGVAPLNWQLASALPTWLSATPTSGSVGPQGSQPLTLSFSVPQTAQSQMYVTNLIVADPVSDNRSVTVPIVVVAGSAATTWGFPQAQVGSGAAAQIALANPSSAPVHVAINYTLGGTSRVVTQNVTLDPYGRSSIDVANAVGSATGSLTAAFSLAITITSDQPIVADLFTATQQPRARLGDALHLNVARWRKGEG